MFTVDDLKKDLPNFPDDVLADWLLPYANIIGWPPARDINEIPENRWKYLRGQFKNPAQHA
jgi:hypothetical protein